MIKIGQRGEPFILLDDGIEHIPSIKCDFNLNPDLCIAESSGYTVCDGWSDTNRG